VGEKCSLLLSKLAYYFYLKFQQILKPKPKEAKTGKPKSKSQQKTKDDDPIRHKHKIPGTFVMSASTLSLVRLPPKSVDEDGAGNAVVKNYNFK
jgi:hypothetical protein